MESLELDCSTENEEDMYLNSAAMLKALKMKNTVPQHNSQKDKGIIQGNEEELKLDVPIQTVNKQGSRKKGGNKSTGARLRSARRKQPNDLVESDMRKIISAQEILSFDNDILIVEQSMGDSVNNIDDNNYEMKIKILWRSKDVHRLNIRRNEGFKKIFEYFANLEQVSIDDIVITKKDKSIKHNDTPASTNLSVIDILEGGIIKRDPTVQKDTNNKTNKYDCLIKVQTNMKCNISIAINQYENFKKLFEKCAEKLHVEEARIKLYFDGELVSVTDTPDSLEIEDEACFDLRLSS